MNQRGEGAAQRTVELDGVPVPVDGDGPFVHQATCTGSSLAPSVPSVRLAAPLLGSSLKAGLVEIAASLVEEVAPIIVAAARGQLDLHAAAEKLRVALEVAQDYLRALRFQIGEQR